MAAIDRRQRRALGIREFSADPRCILRLGLTTASARVELGDGTVVQPGDAVGVIHLWNERMPPIPQGGPNLAWARELKQSLLHSFRLLAHHVVREPSLGHLDALGGQLPLVYTTGSIRLLRRLGLEVLEPSPPRGPLEWAVDMGSRVWTWLLRRAFNAESVRGLWPGELQRRAVWISRRRLTAIHAQDESRGTSDRQITCD